MAQSGMVFLILLLLASFGVAQAQTATPPPGLLIYNVWVRPTAASPAEGATPEAPLPGTITGAYMTIENSGDTDYHLVSVTGGFAEMSMLHQMTLDDSGVMRMRALDGLAIPAGQTVALAPVSNHAMLMNVTHDIYPGQAVALTLTFVAADGSTFDLLVGALATDEPPADDPLIAANALAAQGESGLDVSLIFDNRANQADTLTHMTSVPAASVYLFRFTRTGILPFDSIDIPPQAQTVFAPDTLIMRLTDFAQPPGEAFPLTLTFASGKTMTVAVPVMGETS